MKSYSMLPRQLPSFFDDTTDVTSAFTPTAKRKISTNSLSSRDTETRGYDSSDDSVRSFESKSSSTEDQPKKILLHTEVRLLQQQNQRHSSSNSYGTSMDEGFASQQSTPRLLPPLVRRQRSISLDHEPKSQENNQNHFFGSLDPLPSVSNNGLIFHEKLQHSSSSPLLLPTSILKNCSNDRLSDCRYNLNSPSRKKSVKVTFKTDNDIGEKCKCSKSLTCVNDCRDCLNNNINKDFLWERSSSDSADDTKGSFSIVHSFTPRPRLRKFIRPPTPILFDLLNSDGDEDDSEEDTPKKVCSKSKNVKLQPIVNRTKREKPVKNMRRIIKSDSDGSLQVNSRKGLSHKKPTG